MIFAFEMKPSFNGVISTIVLLNIIAIPVGLVNVLIYKLGFGYSNYMYLREPPPVNNPLIFGEGGRYILNMELIGIAVFIFLLIPFQIKKRFN